MQDMTKRTITSLYAYTECRPLSGRILPAVATMDAMSLHQLISRWVRPEVVSRLHLCVLQSTRSHWENEGEQLYGADTDGKTQDGFVDSVFVGEVEV